MSDYPEHDRLEAIKSESQVIGLFLDFHLPRLGEGMAIYELTYRDCECPGCRTPAGDPSNWHTYEELAPGLPVKVGEWLPTHRTITSLLAESFGIDEEALAAEKDAIYASLKT